MESALTLPAKRRAIQYRLGELVRQWRALKRGERRWTRYFPVDGEDGGTVGSDSAIAGERVRLRGLGDVVERPQPAATYARRIIDRLLIDLSWNSSRLEGNTCSLLDTRRLLTLGVEPDDGDPIEAQMLRKSPPSIRRLDTALMLTREHGVTFHDTPYHALAILGDGVFVTADGRYVAKARAAGHLVLLSDWAASSDPCLPIIARRGLAAAAEVEER